MKNAIEELKERHAQEERKLVAELAILELLPDDLPNKPTISNIRHEPKGDDVHAWMSFRGPAYDPGGKYDPVALLESLERAGFELVPATLCKWAGWRRSTWPGLMEDVPPQKGGLSGSGDELSDADPIAPVWLEPSQHTQTEARMYLRKGGKLFKVSVDVGGIGVRLSARRKETHGDWYFERGSARVSFPEAWHSHPLCGISQHTRGYVDTEKGISGALYFQPHNEQSEWTMKASEFIASLKPTK
jgi:hypothetical protein